MAVAPLAHSIGKLTENQLCGLPASGEKGLTLGRVR
jgi:hypothetical protein